MSARTIEWLKRNKMFLREGRVHLQKCLSLLCLAKWDTTRFDPVWKGTFERRIPACSVQHEAWNALNTERQQPEDWHPWAYNIALNVHYLFMNAVSIRPKIFLSKVDGRNWVLLRRQHSDVWKFLDHSLYTYIKWKRVKIKLNDGSGIYK